MYNPNEADLKEVAENQLKAIDASVRHERYLQAERVALDLVRTLMSLQQIRYGVEEV